MHFIIGSCYTVEFIFVPIFYKNYFDSVLGCHLMSSVIFESSNPEPQL